MEYLRRNVKVREARKLSFLRESVALLLSQARPDSDRAAGRQQRQAEAEDFAGRHLTPPGPHLPQHLGAGQLATDHGARHQQPQHDCRGAECP